jgi:hypothetical protein
MDQDLERIRLRAYEIWENEGRNGDPMEHWLRAERELRPASGGRSDATLEEARPIDSAAALEAIALAAPAAKKPSAGKAKASGAAKDSVGTKPAAAAKAPAAKAPAAAAPRARSTRPAATRKDT